MFKKMFEKEFSNLIPLLIKAHRLKEAADLFYDEVWLSRRSKSYGFEHVVKDARCVMERAVQSYDEVSLIRVLLKIDNLNRESHQAWVSGATAKRIAHARNQEEVRGILREAGDSKLPWSAFLGVFHLQNMGAESAARILMEDVCEAAWPGYRPATRGSSVGWWAGIGTESLIYFLLRAVVLSPDSAARLVCRMYAGKQFHSVPNRYSVWWDLLLKMVNNKFPVASMAGVIDATDDRILPGVVVAGYEELYEARLKAIETIASAADPQWLLRKTKGTWETIAQFKIDKGDIKAACRVLAPLIHHLANLAERANDPNVRQLIDKTMSVVRRFELVPDIPLEVDYHDRCYVYANYAMALSRIGHKDAKSAATAAVVSCELDAASNDPPTFHIARALEILEKYPHQEIVSRALAQMKNQGLEKSKQQDQSWNWEPSPNPRDPFECGLAVLMGKEVPKKVGTDKAKDPKDDEEESLDRIYRKLSVAWLYTGLPCALERSLELETRQSSAARECYQLDVASMRDFVAQQMIHHQNPEEAVKFLTEGIRRTLAEDDVNGAVLLLSTLVTLDPEQAKRSFEDLELKDPCDLGQVLCLILMKLFDNQEDVEAQRAVNHWIKLIPKHRGRIAVDEVILMIMAGNQAILDPHLRYVAHRMLSEAEQILNSVWKMPEQNRKEREKKEGRLYVLGELVSALAGYNTADNAIRERFQGLLDNVLQDRLKQERAFKLDRSLFAALDDPNVEIINPEAVHFYKTVVTRCRASEILPNSLDGLEDMLHAASAMYSQHPGTAFEIADLAFAEAGRRVSELSKKKGFVEKAGETLIDVLTRSIRKRSPGELHAIDFIKAVDRWVWRSKDSRIIGILTGLAEGSSDEAVAHILRAGAASAALVTGHVQETRSLAQQIPGAFLEEASFLGYFNENILELKVARSLLADLIYHVALDSDFFYDVLGKILELGVQERNSNDAAAQLEAIENFLQQVSANSTDIQSPD